MNATAAPIAKEQELLSLGLVETSNSNSINELSPSNENTSKITSAANVDFVNIFICHVIFYLIFCVSLVLHILIDLGLGTLIKRYFIKSIRFRKEIAFKEKLALA